MCTLNDAITDDFAVPLRDITDIVPGQGREVWSSYYMSVVTEARCLHILMDERDFEVWFYGLVFVAGVANVRHITSFSDSIQPTKLPDLDVQREEEQYYQKQADDEKKLKQLSDQAAQIAALQQINEELSLTVKQQQLLNEKLSQQNQQLLALVAEQGDSLATMVAMLQKYEGVIRKAQEEEEAAASTQKQEQQQEGNNPQEEGNNPQEVGKEQKDIG